MTTRHNQWLDLPQHKNPTITNQAFAPYNFVPLPELTIPAVAHPDQLPDHHTYANPDYPHTGYFEVNLITQTPLYIRGGLSSQRPDPKTPSEFEKAEEEKTSNGPDDFRQAMKNKPDFFYTTDPEHPSIPGSSLRGMLRTLLEIVTYSKMQWVTDKRLFFRTVDNSAVGKYYNGRMVQPLGDIQEGTQPKAPGYRSHIRGGFFHFRADGSSYIETCAVARIDVQDILSIFGLRDKSDLYELNGNPLNTADDKKNPNQTPRWQYQYQEITVDIEKAERNHFFPEQFTRTRYGERRRHGNLYLRFHRAAKPSNPRNPQTVRADGTLVLTGHMNYKHLAFIFLKLQSPRTVEVPNNLSEPDANKRLLDRFQDDDQLTQWQKLAFPVNQPANANRPRAGYLRDGEPVFYLMENGEVTFFGRASMFRLPYKKNALDLVPLELRQPEKIDFAEALFGFVRTRNELTDMKKRGLPEPPPNSKARAYASRLSVTDATLAEGQSDIWLIPPELPPLVPAILASPKPTAFQHYLTQAEPDNKQRLNHYDSEYEETPRKTTIRGHKLYWHQGKRNTDGLRAQPDTPNVDRNGNVSPGSSQHTQMRPVKDGVTFSFCVYFENLSDIELGALQWVLTLPGQQNVDYCHAMGMGKPLGMGVVKLQATLHLTHRNRRYQALFAGNTWYDGAEPLPNEQPVPTKTNFVPEFTNHVLNQLPVQTSSFQDIPRIKMLLKMLEWNEQVRNVSHKQYMNDLEAFRARRVLPDPLEV
ncbi:MAG: TIGR03986 family CRISPR-associated RAMP protein [Candidatus Promineifilaceae bacterium]